MLCRTLSENGIEIILSGEELRELDISYEKLDYANTETRRMLWTVLDEAENVLGFDIRLDGRLYIEAHPDKEGGCILRFTVLPGSAGNRVLRKQPGTILFETDSEREIRRVLPFLEDISVRIYEKRGTFRILFFPPTERRAALTAILSEFGSVRENAGLEEAETEEMWTEITLRFSVRT